MNHFVGVRILNLMRPIILAILDGWGYSPQTLGNAIKNAKTPVLDEITKNYPSLLLQASGTAVGMTWGESGNSEVGHLTLGAGRIIFQYLTKINEAIKSGSFSRSPVLKELAGHIAKNQSTLHLIGLLTSGSVHAYIDHLFALLDFAKQTAEKVKVHLFLDGRDSGLKESIQLIEKVKEVMAKKGIGTLATIIGRDYAMDRNNDWAKTEVTYRLLTEGQGESVGDPVIRIKELHAQGINDPDIPALLCDPEGYIHENDAICFFNFREDSMRQLIKAFIQPESGTFSHSIPNNLYIASMTQYVESESLHVLFPPPDVPNSLPELVSKSGMNQLHIAETEKYAHVTYFFNGLKNKPLQGETDVFIDSLHNILEHPEMKADEIAEKVIQELQRGYYGFYVLNFANGDMLSHLGNLEIATKGIEAVDIAIGQIQNAILQAEGILIITSDHGNAESLIYKGTGEKETKHNDNPVPFYLIAKEFMRERSEEDIAKNYTQAQGILADVAPTVLELIGVQKPEEMTGSSLLSQLK